MNQERSSGASPFSALTYREQQDRWLAWRSKQLDYQPAAPEKKQPERPISPPSAYDGGTPPLRVPNMRIASPVRHQELDQVLNRHRQALRQAGEFQSAPID